MLIITDNVSMGLALESNLDPKIRALLILRRDQLLSSTEGKYDLGELAHWIIVDRGDSIAELETAAGFPIAPDPPWEWVLDQDGILEAPTICSDFGFGVVLIVPDEQGVDTALLTLLRADAVPADASGEAS